jgi:hypothetical protein
MQLAHSFLRNLQRNISLLPLAIILGICLGLFASGYWLLDIFPAGSRQLLLLTGVASMFGALGYYVLLSWGVACFLSFSAGRRLALVAVSVLAGALLFFGGTSQWLSSPRYVPFLLPSHRLEISAKPGSVQAGQLALIWFNTSLGDVSYETISLRGWRRAGEQLVLENPADNSVEWVGRTGKEVQMVFRDAGPGEKLTLSWDGNEETISSASGKFDYVHAFQIPWYASGTLILGLGILISASLTLALFLLLWEKRKILIGSIENALSAAESRLDMRDTGWILGIILLALLLRLPNLGGLFPAVDEYYHLIAARQIVEGVALSSVYQRGLWLVTLPVALSLRVFGYQLWAARLTGVLFNVLAILPLYLVTRKINRPIAVISALLYATSPWIITFARIAREYAYYPFYFYWIIFGMISFIQGIPKGFVLPRQWRRLASPKTILVGLSLVIPPFFALYGDRLSTFRTILIAYVVFSIFLLARFSLRDRLNWPLLAVLGSTIFVVSYVGYQRQSSKLLPYPQFNALPVEYFLPNPQQQWYFDRLAILIVLGLLVVGALAVLLRRTNFIPLFIFVLYSIYLLIFAFFAKTFFHTRHVLTTELWYIVVVALGMYLVWKGIQGVLSFKGKMASIALAVVLGLSVINVGQVVLPITSTDPDNPISQDYLHDLTQVHAFMIAHVQPHDVLISTVYGLYSSWQEQPKFDAQYRITTQTPPQEIFSLVAEHESGWIVIDQIRLGLSSLSPRDFAGNRDIEYLGLFGDEYVWHWQHPTGTFGVMTVLGKGQ